MYTYSVNIICCTVMFLHEIDNCRENKSCDETDDVRDMFLTMNLIKQKDYCRQWLDVIDFIQV